MLTKRILIIIYVAAGIGAIALCQKMISTISDIAPKRIIFVQSEKAAIFSAPSEQSAVLMDLKAGDKLEYVKSEGEWVAVRNGPFEGYIRREDTDLKQGE